MHERTDRMNQIPNVTHKAHLIGRLCLSRLLAQLHFGVATQRRSKDPIFFLEGLNIVLTDREGSDDFEEEVPSACMPGGEWADVTFDSDSGEFRSDFEVLLDIPAARRQADVAADPRTDTPGPTAVRTTARMSGRFAGELVPRPYAFQMARVDLEIDVPEDWQRTVGEKVLRFPELTFPFQWFYGIGRRQLELQPVFIEAGNGKPPTGEDFYPLLQRANEIWAKCCIRFTARCPIYIDEQQFRILTAASASTFKDQVNVPDAIEVFMAERFDPPETFGGGATFSSGTASAKVVTGDNQLPINQNHLAHELGHVLGLGHPGNTTDNLIDGCTGSVLEPSGFFADNPSTQCEANCDNAANPLLTYMIWDWCLTRPRPDDELF